MLMNLFEIFDPCIDYKLNLPMNWLGLFLFLFLLPYNYWILPNRSMNMYIMLMNNLYNEIKVLTSNKFKINILFFLNLMIIILNINITGLFPYIFTSTSHMSFNLSMALPMWLGFMIYSMMNNPIKLIAHFVPKNTPLPLMNFMSLIEFISTMIRPWTLSIRLTANMIAGHLLMTLLGNFITLISYIYPMLLISIIIQNMLFMLEISVAFIQSYVFMILTVLYFMESK